ncbi:MAG: NAD-dependent epimerase/dehydratase family protein [Oscillospiraceae bacterium]|jgi:dihydroflavonol-4-reductase|nr:NAD-dependent epimerase/dehydratase family protein [Oscillospiraceae bacterium]
MEPLYILTGAAGHLGSAVLQTLKGAGSRVRALVLPSERNKIKEAGIEVITGNVLEPDSLKPLLRGINGDDVRVIHAAGIVSIASKTNPAVHDVNVEGTRNILRLCKENDVGKLVYVSSVHAIPEKPHGETILETADFNPESVNGDYAKTKAEATCAVLDAAASGLNASVVHPSGILGPYDEGNNHLNTMVIDYCRGKLSVGVRGGYDFVDVRDVADGVVSCCEKGRPGECYILANKYFTVAELLKALSEITGLREIKSILPLWFAKLTAPLAELYYKVRRQQPLFTAYSLYTLSSNAEFSHEKAEKELGFHPRELAETLRDTIAWLRQKRVLA